MYFLCVIGFGGDECIVCVLQGLVVMSAVLISGGSDECIVCVYAGFGGDECIVCVLQGLVVMSADLEEVVMSVLFVCCRVWW